jgi:CDGSH-type Zn-finger protein
MADVRIKIRKNGPILVEAASVDIVDHEGRPFGLGGRTNVVLCRCGASATKPFCDGSHNKAGFASECSAFELSPPQPKA